MLRCAVLHVTVLFAAGQTVFLKQPRKAPGEIQQSLQSSPSPLQKQPSDREGCFQYSAPYLKKQALSSLERRTGRTYILPV